MSVYGKILKDKIDIDYPYLEGIDTIPFEYDDFQEGVTNLLYMSEQSFNLSIMDSIIEDATDAQEGESKSDSTIHKVIEAIKKWAREMLARLKGMFSKYMAIVDRYLRSAADFYKAHKTELDNAKSVKYLGYHFESLNPVVLQDFEMANVKNIESANEFTEQKKQELLGCAPTNEDFSKQLFKLFRSGKAEKEEIDFAPNYISSVLKDGADIKSKAEKQFKSLYSGLDKLSRLGSMASKAFGGEKANLLTSCMRININLVQEYQGGLMQAMKDEMSQAMNVAVLMVKSSNKESKKIDESVIIDIDEASSLTTKERNALPDSMFGLPKDRKYPMPDAESVHSAIKLFGHCPEEKRHILAKNIKKFMKKYNVSMDNPKLDIWKYVSESVISDIEII